VLMSVRFRLAGAFLAAAALDAGRVAVPLRRRHGLLRCRILWLDAACA